MRSFQVAAAAVLLAASAAAAHAQRPDDRRGPPDARGQQDARGQHDARGRDARDQRDAQQAQGRQLSAQEQQLRIAEQRQRDEQYQARLNRQVAMAQRHGSDLQAQRRNAEYSAHQQYLQNLQEQRQRLQAQRDYSRDPAFTTAPTYRYRVGSAYHQTNQYGVDVLRQAVNNGYAQGVRYGQADRSDGQRPNYQASYAYRDANYGYTGQYVAQSDYNNYFREGFRRGYQDAYSGRAQYGNVSTGTGTILGNVLSSILGLQPIR